MKFFIDTANLDQIKEAQDLGVLDGVTTNPSLMAKEGISGTENVKAHYKAICDIVDGDVSAEVIATDYDAMIKEGEELAAIDEKIVVKIPMIKDGVKALKYFSNQRHQDELYLDLLSRPSLDGSQSWRDLREPVHRPFGRHFNRRFRFDREHPCDLRQL